MRRSFIIAWALLLAGLCCIQQSSAFWQSRDSNYNNASFQAQYQGPGDVQSGWTVWGSTARAYSAAYAASNGNAFIAADASTGAITCTVPFLATGFVNLSGSICAGNTLTLSAFCAANTSCVVSEVYDETGNGNHTVQATLANMPGLVFNALNGLPAFNCSAASMALTTAANITQAQPLSLSVVGKRTNSTNAGGMIGTQANGVLINGTSSANQWSAYAGTAVNVSATDSAFHGLNATFNNTTSGYNIDGTDSGNVSTGSLTFSATPYRFCRGNLTQWIGEITEGGMYPGLTNSTLRAALFTNMNTAYGGAL